MASSFTFFFIPSASLRITVLAFSYSTSVFEDLVDLQLAKAKKLLVISRAWRCFRSLQVALNERLLNGCDTIGFVF